MFLSIFLLFVSSNAIVCDFTSNFQKLFTNTSFFSDVVSLIAIAPKIKYTDNFSVAQFNLDVYAKQKALTTR